MQNLGNKKMKKLKCSILLHDSRHVGWVASVDGKPRKTEMIAKGMKNIIF